MTLSRRNLLVGAGTVGLLAIGAGAGVNQGQAEGQQKAPADLEKILEAMKLSDAQLAESGAAPTLQLAPVIFLPHNERMPLKIAKREAERAEIRDSANSLLATALRWTCSTDVINELYIGTTPLIARRFTYSVTDISWQAGDGWPVYHQYCPTDQYHTGMWYRHAKVHQIVPSIKGQNYFIGCLSSAIAESAASGQVCFAVNDGGGDYGDNRGTFVVTITSWS